MVKGRITLRDVNNLLKKKGIADNTEATHYKGKYWLLHICKNNVPVPLFSSKNVKDVYDYAMTV